MSKPRKALFITYTFGNPIVAGVFFRAIRLASALSDRGWTCCIFNFGPLLKDPKVESLGSGTRINNELEISDVWKAFRQLRDLEPDIVIFGEAPLGGAMQLLWRAAEMLGKPFILLEQYYDLGTPGKFDVDLMLLYGLKCFWKRHSNGRRRWIIIPPFIDEVTPSAELPVPPAPRSAPRVLILGGEAIVLNEGIQLLADITDPSPQVVAISGNPAIAARQMRASGIPANHAIALPLQSDANLFGLLQSSSAAITANGFMQMTEALALGCPAVLVDRGIGMWPCQVDEVFQPYVSFGEREAQRDALRRWLKQSPFDDRLREQLKHERNGAAECAGHIERVAAEVHSWRRKWRQAAWCVHNIRKTIESRFQTHEAVA
jgi:UDP-N-acetylglucosamine:LPS N-acetylglucosamine transferase